MVCVLAKNRGENIVMRNFSKQKEAIPALETIGQKKILGLWTLDRA